MRSIFSNRGIRRVGALVGSLAVIASCGQGASSSDAGDALAAGESRPTVTSSEPQSDPSVPGADTSAAEPEIASDAPYESDTVPTEASDTESPTLASEDRADDGSAAAIRVAETGWAVLGDVALLNALSHQAVAMQDHDPNPALEAIEATGTRLATNVELFRVATNSAGLAEDNELPVPHSEEGPDGDPVLQMGPTVEVYIQLMRDAEPLFLPLNPILDDLTEQMAPVRDALRQALGPVCEVVGLGTFAPVPVPTPVGISQFQAVICS